MFIFPFARSYPAYKWPVGEYILPPRLLCVCERARVTSSNGVHIHSVRKESRRQRVPVGFNPWWKRGKCLSFFLCLVFSLRDQREKRRMGASVQGTKDTVVFFSFPLRLFSGRRLPTLPLGNEGDKRVNERQRMNLPILVLVRVVFLYCAYLIIKHKRLCCSQYKHVVDNTISTGKRLRKNEFMLMTRAERNSDSDSKKVKKRFGYIKNPL